MKTLIPFFILVLLSACQSRIPQQLDQVGSPVQERVIGVTDTIIQAQSAVHTMWYICGGLSILMFVLAALFREMFLRFLIAGVVCLGATLVLVVVQALMPYVVWAGVSILAIGALFLIFVTWKYRLATRAAVVLLDKIEADPHKTEEIKKDAIREQFTQGVSPIIQSMRKKPVKVPPSHKTGVS